MTRTRLLAALVMAPLAIAAILLLPTPWMVALAAVLFLAGLWEWFDLAQIEDTLARTVLLVANLAVMVALVWASRSSGGYTMVAVPAGQRDRRGLVAAGAAVAGPLRVRQRPRHQCARVQARRRRAEHDSGVVRAGLDPARASPTAIAGC